MYTWEDIAALKYDGDLNLKSIYPITPDMAQVCYEQRAEHRGIHRNVQPIVYS